jgi:hypothetical protein
LLGLTHRLHTHPLYSVRVWLRNRHLAVHASACCLQSVRMVPLLHHLRAQSPPTYSGHRSVLKLHSLSLSWRGELKTGAHRSPHGKTRVRILSRTGASHASHASHAGTTAQATNTTHHWYSALLRASCEREKKSLFSCLAYTHRHTVGDGLGSARSHPSVGFSTRREHF